MASKRSSGTSKSIRTDFARERLELITKSSLYRRMRTVTVNGATATVDGRQAVHLCSNDYLGLSRNAHVIGRMVESAQEVSQCSSRLIAGNHPIIAELEGMLAGHRKVQAALVYPTGYSANLGAITAIADRNSVIFSDALNHASIIDACRLSGAQVKVFRHNDVGHLEEMVKKAARTPRKIVVTEGVFSMDGDVARLAEISEIANRFDAITVVDDAHGDFIFGPEFAGVPAASSAGIDVHVSSLSKGLGCFGGYVAVASEQTRELLVNTSRQFIYTSALPAHLCAAAMAAIPLAKRGDLQARLRKNIGYFARKMRKAGFALGNSGPAPSQIIPILVGEESRAVAFSQELLKEGVFAQAVRYPTVERGSARLRVSLTSMHTQNQLAFAAEAFEAAGRRCGVI